MKTTADKSHVKPRSFRLLCACAAQEWRRWRRSPVWMIGLVAAGFLLVSESGSSNVLGFPTASQSLYGFQLACSMLLGIVAFLLTAGSLASDLEGTRGDLVFSRPLATPLYLAGKYVGALSFSLALVFPLILLAASAPMFHGTLRFHPPARFLVAVCLSVVPALCYACALAIFLTAIFRKVVVTLPIFLIYFFTVVLLHAGSGSGGISLLDFSQRLYPRELVVQVPLRLSECTFAGLLDPVAPALLFRAILYVVLSLLLLVGAGWALGFRLDARVCAELGAAVTRLFRRRKLSLGAGFCEAPASTPRLSMPSIFWASAAQGPQGSVAQAFLNELQLLVYSAKILAGRNLLAVALACLGIIATVLGYTVGPYQTREGSLVMHVEMFAPLLGVLLFSDLVASEFEAGRAPLLRTSTRGAPWLVLRRMMHATIFSAGACLGLLLALRIIYVPFEVLHALVTVLPGVLFFGALAMVAATLTHRSLVGYAVGAGAMVLGLTLPQVEPLTPMAFHLRRQLANDRLMGEFNWLLAKTVYVGLALLLAGGVLNLLRKINAWKRVGIGSLVLISGTFTLMHFLWSAPRPQQVSAKPQSRELSAREEGEVRLVRRVDVAPNKPGPDALESATLLDVRMVRQGEGWQVEREIPVDLTREFELRHLDLDAAVAPSEARFNVEARFAVKPISGAAERLCFFLAAEFQVQTVTIDGRPAAVLKHGDLVEIPLSAPAELGREVQVFLAYGGTLRLPQNLQYERVAKDLLFVTSRWYPSLHQRGGDRKNLFTYRAVLHVPKAFHVAAAVDRSADFSSRSLSKQAESGNAYLLESAAFADCIPLFIGTFQEFTGKYRDVSLSFCSFTGNAQLADKTFAAAARILEDYEQSFGPYPFSRLAVVENRFQSAGGAAYPALVAMKPERLVPEHEERFLEGYLPYELAHLWWSGMMPPWVAEGVAVFVSTEFLERACGVPRAMALLDNEIVAPYLSQRDASVPLINALGVDLYARGGYLARMLQAQVGRQAVFDRLRAFRDSLRDRSVVDFSQGTDGFLNELKEAAGPQWAGFVEDWARTVKRFDPAIAWLTQEPSKNGFRASLCLEHLAEIRFPVPVRLKFKSGATRDLVWAGNKQNETLEIECPEMIASAELDPEHRLLDYDRQNNICLPGVRRSPQNQRENRFAGWKTYTPSDGLPGTDVRCLALGGDGAVYAGIWSLQAAMNRQWAVAVFNGIWQRYDPGLDPIHLVTTIKPLPDGSLWLASQHQLRWIHKKTSRDFTFAEINAGGIVGRRQFRPSPATNSSIKGSQAYCLLHDQTGRLWLGTDHGLTVLSQAGEPIAEYGPDKGLAGREIFCLLEGQNGTVYAGTEAGVFCFDGKNWNREDRLPRDLTLCSAAGPHQTLWFGTFRSGVIALDVAGVRSYSAANRTLMDTIVCSLAVDEKGGVWAGSPDGLLHFDGRAWGVFNRKNSGLPSNQVRSIVVDPRGQIWVGTDVGVTEYTPPNGKGEENGT